MTLNHFPHNAFGLYNMLVNVSEWCKDRWYDYKEEPQIDPVHDDQNVPKGVHKGGSWYTPILYNTCSHRHMYLIDNDEHIIGLRIIYSVKQERKHGK